MKFLSNKIYKEYYELKKISKFTKYIELIKLFDVNLLFYIQVSFYYQFLIKKKMGIFFINNIEIINVHVETRENHAGKRFPNYI